MLEPEPTEPPLSDLMDPIEVAAWLESHHGDGSVRETIRQFEMAFLMGRDRLVLFWAQVLDALRERGHSVVALLGKTGEFGTITTPEDAAGILVSRHGREGAAAWVIGRIAASRRDQSLFGRAIDTTRFWSQVLAEIEPGPSRAGLDTVH